MIQIVTELRARTFVPPDTQFKFWQAVHERVGKPRRGTEKLFSELTGLDYGVLRQWISKPIIPFLFAEFVAVWLDTTVEGLMELGVRITTQIRRKRGCVKESITGRRIPVKNTPLKAPNSEILNDPHFRYVAWMLDSKGFLIEYGTEALGKNRLLNFQNLSAEEEVRFTLYHKMMESRIQELIQKYTSRDVEMFSHLPGYLNES